jgi:hypothetical protein
LNKSSGLLDTAVSDDTNEEATEEYLVFAFGLDRSSSMREAWRTYAVRIAASPMNTGYSSRSNSLQQRQLDQTRPAKKMKGTRPVN